MMSKSSVGMAMLRWVGRGNYFEDAVMARLVSSGKHRNNTLEFPQLETALS